MKTGNRLADRRQFLGWLAAVAAGVGLAGVSGCGKAEDPKPSPPRKLPSQPDKKEK